MPATMPSSNYHSLGSTSLPASSQVAPSMVTPSSSVVTKPVEDTQDSGDEESREPAEGSFFAHPTCGTGQDRQTSAAQSSSHTGKRSASPSADGGETSVVDPRAASEAVSDRVSVAENQNGGHDGKPQDVQGNTEVPDATHYKMQLGGGIATVSYRGQTVQLDLLPVYLSESSILPIMRICIQDISSTSSFPAFERDCSMESGVTKPEYNLSQATLKQWLLKAGYLQSWVDDILTAFYKEITTVVEEVLVEVEEELDRVREAPEETI